MKKKVLIIIADIGNGHKSAANAITSVFNSKYSDKYSVKTIDLFKEADVEPFNSADISYKFLSQNRAYEHLSNFIWKLTNTSIGYSIYKSYLLNFLYKVSEKIIMKEDPDILISAYPLTSTIMGELKKNGYKFKYVVVITDLMTIHKSWADARADLITCPTPDAVSTLIKFGVDINKIIYPFFPLRPELTTFRSKEEVLKELNLSADLPILLLTGGGLGTKAIAKVIGKLVKRTDIQVIIIAGKLEDFKEDLEAKYGNHHNVRILGFVNNMHDYINACDILIGKPGATTVMEIELFNKKAIFTRYIGEQDYGNVEYSVRDPKIRYIGEDWSKLNHNLDELLNFVPREADVKLKRNFDETETIVEEIIKLG